MFALGATALPVRRPDVVLGFIPSVAAASLGALAARALPAALRADRPRPRRPRRAAERAGGAARLARRLPRGAGRSPGGDRPRDHRRGLPPLLRGGRAHPARADPPACGRGRGGSSRPRAARRPGARWAGATTSSSACTPATWAASRAWTTCSTRRRCSPAPNVRVVLARRRQRPRAAPGRAAALGLDHVTFADFAGPGRYESLLAAADVLLVNQAPSVADMSLPSKLTSYFASGQPVVAAIAPDSETAREIGQAQAGIVVPPADARALADALLAVRDDPARGAGLGERGPALRPRGARPREDPRDVRALRAPGPRAAASRPRRRRAARRPSPPANSAPRSRPRSPRRRAAHASRSSLAATSASASAATESERNGTALKPGDRRLDLGRVRLVVGVDHRHAEAEALRDRQPDVARRDARDRRRVERAQALRVADVPGEHDPVAEPRLVRQRAQARLLGPGADEHEPPVRREPAEPRPRTPPPAAPASSPARAGRRRGSRSPAPRRRPGASPRPGPRRSARACTSAPGIRSSSCARCVPEYVTSALASRRCPWRRRSVREPRPPRGHACPQQHGPPPRRPARGEQRPGGEDARVELGDDDARPQQPPEREPLPEDAAPGEEPARARAAPRAAAARPSGSSARTPASPVQTSNPAPSRSASRAKNGTR